MPLHWQHDSDSADGFSCFTDWQSLVEWVGRYIHSFSTGHRQLKKLASVYIFVRLAHAGARNRHLPLSPLMRGLFVYLPLANTQKGLFFLSPKNIPQHYSTKKYNCPPSEFKFVSFSKVTRLYCLVNLLLKYNAICPNSIVTQCFTLLPLSGVAGLFLRLPG